MNLSEFVKNIQKKVKDFSLIDTEKIVKWLKVIILALVIIAIVVWIGLRIFK